MEGANTIPGLPVMTGPPLGDPTTGRSGSAPSEIVVVVVAAAAVVECYCYLKNIVVEPPGPATVTGTRD